MHTLAKEFMVLLLSEAPLSVLPHGPCILIRDTGQLVCKQGVDRICCGISVTYFYCGLEKFSSPIVQSLQMKSKC